MRQLYGSPVIVLSIREEDFVRFSLMLMFQMYICMYKCFSHQAVNACLVPLFAIHGRAVITVEGVGSVKSGMHPIQVCLFVCTDVKFHFKMIII